jgi:hypothetical protein
MGIPEAQLETWSHQGAITQSKTTYGTIKSALEAPGSAYSAETYKVFLQGSYGNDTNIYRESDVDVVMRLDSSFQHDLEELPQGQKDAFMAAYPAATYTYNDFRRDVLSQLQGAEFGASVKPGTKAVKIKAGGSRRDADVLIAMQFRRYDRFVSRNDEEFDRGICFWTSGDTRVVNYPRQHSENCTTKQQATSSGDVPLNVES